MLLKFLLLMKARPVLLTIGGVANVALAWVFATRRNWRDIMQTLTTLTKLEQSSSAPPSTATAAPAAMAPPQPITPPPAKGAETEGRVNPISITATTTPSGWQKFLAALQAIVDAEVPFILQLEHNPTTQIETQIGASALNIGVAAAAAVSSPAPAPVATPAIAAAPAAATGLRLSQ